MMNGSNSWAALIGIEDPDVYIPVKEIKVSKVVVEKEVVRKKTVKVNTSKTDEFTDVLVKTKQTKRKRQGETYKCKNPVCSSRIPKKERGCRDCGAVWF